MKKFTIKLSAIALTAMLALPIGAQANTSVVDYYNSNLNGNEEVRVANIDTTTTTITGSTTAVTGSIAHLQTGLQMHFVKMYGEGMSSNDDNVRRTSLENEYNIVLENTDSWEDKSLTDKSYTSHSALKADFTYAVNANRQSLIQYGVRTNDWQPYRWFSAMTEPAFFEIDPQTGKIEYSKLYYAKSADSLLASYRSDYYNARTDEEKKLYRDIFNKELKDYVTNYNKAPGFPVYSVELNRNEDVRKITGAIAYDNRYFDSVYNKPEVRYEGKYPDGYNPWKEMKERAKKGETITNFDHKYTIGPISTNNLNNIVDVFDQLNR